jgi:hypothetical protein
VQTKNIFFVEFIENVESIDKFYEKNDIIIALSPEVASELDLKNIPYKTLQEDYYSHKDYVLIIDKLEKQLFKIIEKLDFELEKFDNNFELAKIKPFYRHIYFFKFIFDNIRVKIFELDSLFKKEHINKIKYFEVKNQPIINFYEFSDSESIYQKLLVPMSKNYNYTLNPIKLNQNVNIPIKSYSTLIKNFLRPIKKSLVNIKFRPIKKSKKILSVNCREIESVGDYFAKEGWQIYPFTIKHNTKVDEKFSKLFMGKLAVNKIILNEFSFLDIEFFNLIKNRIEFFCNSLISILDHYYSLDNYINKNNFNIVFFETLTPFKVENVLLPLICKNRKIPYVCWMHGGAGNNKTLNGYKFSDHIFGSHYFIYGEQYKDLIHKYNSKFKLIPHVTGSPLIIKRYANYIAPKNKKKVVTIVTGPTGNRNIYHLFDDPNYRFDYYFPLKAAIKIAAKYKNKYRVIIRLHDNKSQRDLINNLLKKNNAQHIELIDTKAMPFKKIVSISDLFINFIVSTTFYEECISNADIFIYDNSDLTNKTKKIINNRSFWFNNIKTFSNDLNKYLEDGIFHQKSNDNSFLNDNFNWNRKSEIAQNTYNTVKNIVEL